MHRLNDAFFATWTPRAQGLLPRFPFGCALTGSASNAVRRPRLDSNDGYLRTCDMHGHADSLLGCWVAQLDRMRGRSEIVHAATATCLSSR